MVTNICKVELTRQYSANEQICFSLAEAQNELGPLSDSGSEVSTKWLFPQLDCEKV